MVQGETKNSSINYVFDKSSKDSSKYVKENQMNDKNYKQQINNQKNYGAWGPVFKNRQNFNEMHIC